MKITKINIGRLYNLGNYEHVRYDLTVEVADNESAATAVVALEKILAGLKPIKDSVKSERDLEHGQARIDTMKAMTDDEWQSEYGHAKGTRAEVIARYETALADERKKRELATARAKEARRLFDDLNGAEKWTDAKLDWEDDYDL